MFIDMPKNFGYNSESNDLYKTFETPWDGNQKGNEDLKKSNPLGIIKSDVDSQDEVTLEDLNINNINSFDGEGVVKNSLKNLASNGVVGDSLKFVKSLNPSDKKDEVPYKTRDPWSNELKKVKEEKFKTIKLSSKLGTYNSIENLIGTASGMMVGAMGKSTVSNITDDVLTKFTGSLGGLGKTVSKLTSGLAGKLERIGNINEMAPSLEEIVALNMANFYNMYSEKPGRVIKNHGGKFNYITQSFDGELDGAPDRNSVENTIKDKTSKTKKTLNDITNTVLSGNIKNINNKLKEKEAEDFARENRIIPTKRDTAAAIEMAKQGVDNNISSYYYYNDIKVGENSKEIKSKQESIKEIKEPNLGIIRKESEVWTAAESEFAPNGIKASDYINGNDFFEKKIKTEEEKNSTYKDNIINTSIKNKRDQIYVGEEINGQRFNLKSGIETYYDGKIEEDINNEKRRQNFKYSEYIDDISRKEEEEKIKGADGNEARLNLNNYNVLLNRKSNEIKTGIYEEEKKEIKEKSPKDYFDENFKSNIISSKTEIISIKRSDNEQEVAFLNKDTAEVFDNLTKHSIESTEGFNTLKTRLKGADTINKNILKGINGGTGGYLYVEPYYNYSNIAEPFTIPFEFNPIINDGGIEAKYSTEELMGRILSVRSYVGTDFSTITLETKYLATSNSVSGISDSNIDWMTYWTTANLTKIERAYRSLTLPYIQSGKNGSSPYYSRPPIVRIKMYNPVSTNDIDTNYEITSTDENETTTSESFVNELFTYPIDDSDEDVLEVTKNIDGFLKQKRFIVTNLSINPIDSEDYANAYRLDKNAAVRRGFSVSLTLAETTKNFLDTIPNYYHYINKINELNVEKQETFEKNKFVRISNNMDIPDLKISTYLYEKEEEDGNIEFKQVSIDNLLEYIYDKEQI